MLEPTPAYLVAISSSDAMVDAVVVGQKASPAALDCTRVKLKRSDFTGAYNPGMHPKGKKLSRKRLSTNPAERLFVAAYGRRMTAAEREKFILEKPATLEELARRAREEENYGFLRQT